MIIKDCSIVVDSLDMSDWLRALTFSEEVEQQDATVHGDNFDKTSPTTRSMRSCPVY